MPRATGRFVGSHGARYFAAAALILLLALPFSGVRAGDSFSGDGWTGLSVADADGRFTHCVTSRPMARGTSFAFVLTQDAWSILLTNDGWKLPAGRHYRLRMTVDNGKLQNADSVAESGTQLRIPQPLNPEWVGSLAAGTQLRVRSGSFDQTYPLAGSGAALGGLFGCVSKELGATAERSRIAAELASEEAARKAAEEELARQLAEQQASAAAAMASSASEEAASSASSAAEAAASSSAQAAVATAEEGASPPATYESMLDAYNRGDYAAALIMLHPLAIHGDVRAQIKLGMMYEAGRGVAQDFGQALFWYRMAAESSDPFAQVRLGDFYQFGNGVKTDYNEAFRWYQRAAATGYPLGQYDLAQSFELGRGTPISLAEAERWYQRASDGGLGLATIALQRVRKSRADQPRAYEVALEEQGGTFVVPVLINGVIVLDFTVDSGASDVSIPADVVRTLMRAGTISVDDFTGKKDYVLADGSGVSSETFRITSLKVGDVILNCPSSDDLAQLRASTSGVLASSWG